MKREHRKSSSAQPTLVLGATGKTGRRVVSRLHASAFAREVAITETWRIVA